MEGNLHQRPLCFSNAGLPRARLQGDARQAGEGGERAEGADREGHEGRQGQDGEGEPGARFNETKKIGLSFGFEKRLEFPFWFCDMS